MSKETVEVLVEGGKATAAPPLGPALGPLGVNIGKVVAEINQKTASFKNLQVPVKVVIDTETKEFTISVGTPPTSQLIKKEAEIDKGSSNPKDEKIADLKIEQVIKIAKMKEDSLTGKTVKDKVKEVVGTAGSMGVMVEGMDFKNALKAVNESKFDKEILSGKTELSSEELKALEEEKKKLAEEIKEKHDVFVKQAQAIIKENEGKEAHFIRTKLRDAKIPEEIIKELLPEDNKAAPGGKAAQGKGPAKAAPGKAKK